MSSRSIVFSIVIGLGLFIASGSLFVVTETELAIKFRLGEIVKSDYEPGLHVKVPFVNNVRKYDSRILTLDARPERYLTKEKKNVLVDFFVKWRINDVEVFYKSMNGSVNTARTRIYTIVNDGLRSEIDSRTVKEVISGERAALMDKAKEIANISVKNFGIEIVDVRVKRIDYEQSISESVYRRMVAERTRVAKEFRSKGAEAAERIKADADRQRTVLLAEAYRTAQKTRGDGDAKAASIYAKAYTKDREFYSFYRSLNAYRTSFSSDNDLLVIQPDSEFFKYFKKAK
ncbi:HflC protein [hydrothermal vent metagenome]|uniref:HflC protein n=1 Tax=hydrothermal vent metagenome TaxID=652676 RepID=A0A3B0ZS50_9ZZZZ